MVLKQTSPVSYATGQLSHAAVPPELVSTNTHFTNANTFIFL